MEAFVGVLLRDIETPPQYLLRKYGFASYYDETVGRRGNIG